GPWSPRARKKVCLPKLGGIIASRPTVRSKEPQDRCRHPLFPRSASRGLGDLLQDRAMLRYLFSLILLALPSLSHAQLAHTWMAGVAKVKITREKLMWMSGYGARDKPAEGKLTELWAKALALQNVEGQRCLLITMDLVGIDRALSQAVCAALQKSH